MRRWQVPHRSRGRLYLGFGANYRSEIDYLETTRWNCEQRANSRLFHRSRVHQSLGECPSEAAVGLSVLLLKECSVPTLHLFRCQRLQMATEQPLVTKRITHRS
jgi:hypothetical protein